MNLINKLVLPTIIIGKLRLNILSYDEVQEYAFSPKLWQLTLTCIERWLWWREGEIINENCPLNISLSSFVIAQPWKLPTIIFYCISYRIFLSIISHHVEYFYIVAWRENWGKIIERVHRFVLLMFLLWINYH